MEDVIFNIDPYSLRDSSSRGRGSGGDSDSDNHSRRILAVVSRQNANAASSQSAKWKNALWDKNAIEPAMLRVPIVIIVLILLWGLDVWCMDKMRLQYHSAISVKTAPLAFAFITAIALTITYALNMTLFSTVLGLSVEIGVTAYYSILLVIFCSPLPIPGQENRASFFRLFKLVFMPGGSITFPEVLLADALTSLSKVFKDIGVTIVAVCVSAARADIVEHHDKGMILIAVLASLPYWLRVRQCWVQLESTNNDFIAKIPITLNIIKYLSAFPPIWLAAAASLGYFHKDLPKFTGVMAGINSIYSFGWDVVMDWGLITFTRTGRVFGRQRAMYPWICYVIAVCINLVLRFSWAANHLKFFRNLHASHLLLLMELAEVFRRAMWNLFRIEWEVVNVIMQQERLAVRDDEEADKMLIKIPKQITSVASLLPP